MQQRTIPTTHEIARESQRAVEQQLAPCITTRLGQGDDYGLDGYVQHVRPGRPPIRTSLLFGLQIKGHEAAFQEINTEQFRVAHLVDWTSIQVPVVVAVHSTSTGATRWRLASEMVLELDASSPGWRTQDSVTVQFLQSNQLSNQALHDWIQHSLARSSDLEGGQTRFHRTFRSVLLTEIYHDHAFVGQRGELAERPGGPGVARFVTGMQWTQGELDETAVEATRVLSGALLLFEQIYFPSSLAYAVVGALGPTAFLRLLEQRRLVPILYPTHELAFIIGNENIGDLYFLNGDMNVVFERELTSLASRYGLNRQFVRRVNEAARRMDVPDRVSQELLTVSKLPYIRDLVGLGLARPQAQEPPWAAERLLRIGNVVKYYATAQQLSVDIVEFEPGLGRIAAARWGSSVQFHRVYQALAELERCLEASALPDIGLLSQRIGMQRCIEISSSTGGSSFREWFWQAASEAISNTGSLEGEIAQRLRAFVDSGGPLPRDLLVAVTETETRTEGLAVRRGGAEALDRQVRFSAQRVREQFLRDRGALPHPESPCPCGSDASFRQCCGRILF